MRKAVSCTCLMAMSVLAAHAALAAQQKKSAAAPKSVVSQAEVHSIYIQAMPGGFNEYLAGELLRRLPRGVMLTQNKASADAVLEGTSQQSHHGISRTVNQVLGGGSATGAVELVTGSGHILWATEKSDHTIPIATLWREHGYSKVAAKIAKNLAAALKRAQRRQARSRRAVK